MIRPSQKRYPIQVGVQGGFLIVRPNITEFNKYLHILKHDTTYKKNIGWGGKKGTTANGIMSYQKDKKMDKKLTWGGYYGDSNFQGLVSYFYGRYVLYAFLKV